MSLSRRKKHAPHANHERWLVSYADFITLLFAFFVVMFASSQSDKAKVTAVSESVNAAIKNGGIAASVHEILGGTVDEVGKGNAQIKGPGGREPLNPKDANAAVAELLPSADYLTRALKDQIKSGKLDIHMESRGLVLSLRQAAFFPSGEDAIDPATYPMLDKIGATLKDLHNSVRLEGHTDSIPIHTARFRSNWELSTARGIAVLDLLESRYQIPHDRLAVAGYADTAPVDSNQEPEGRAHNRRVDIVILNQSTVLKDSGAAQPPSAKQAPSGV